MTAQFYEGQEVEVYYPFSRSNEVTWPWVKAKILQGSQPPSNYIVQFLDGTRTVFDAEHIRAAEPVVGLANFVARRQKIIEELVQQERDIAHWNSIHPNETPIVLDDSGLPDWAKAALKERLS